MEPIIPAEVWLDECGSLGASDDDRLTIALCALVAAGGGVLNLGLRDHHFCEQTTLPNDGTQETPLLPAKQVPIDWSGLGNDTDGPAGGVKTPKGTNLNFSYQGPGARLQTLGRGAFRLRSLNICAGDTPANIESTPLLLTTNTSIDVDASVSFYGPPNRVGASADCDAILLGGSSPSLLNGNDSAFQGYNTVIDYPFFSACRRLVWARTYCNSIPIGVRSWSSCGNPLPEGAAIELSGGADNCSGNVITGLIEVVRYPFAVKLTKGLFNNINVQAYDAGDRTIGTVLCESSSYGNTIIAGMPLARGLPTLVDRTPTKANSYISNQAVELSRLFCLASGIPGYPNQFGPTVFNDPINTVFQSALPSGAGKILKVRRSLLDTNPDAEVFAVDGLGGVYLGNTGNSGNINNALPTGTQWYLNGRGWGFPGRVGAPMEVDTGTGGSQYTVKSYGQVWKDHTGATIGRIGWGKKGFAFGETFDVQCYRDSSTVWRTNVKVTTDLGIGVGNSASATTLGTLSKKTELFDAAGNSIGFVPIYTDIT